MPCVLVLITSTLTFAAGRKCYSARFDFVPQGPHSPHVEVCFDGTSTPFKVEQLQAAYATKMGKIIEKPLR